MYEGYIYCIENTITHMKYVGQTRTTIEKRWRSHCSSSKDDQRYTTYLYQSMRLHGVDNFTISEIAKIAAPTVDDLKNRLNEHEIFYITELSTLFPKGYNMTAGGQVLSIPASRSVVKVDDNGYIIAQFNSIRDAAVNSDVNEKSVWSACNKSKTHYCAGYFWYYASDLPANTGTNLGIQSKGKTNWKGHNTHPCKPVDRYTKDGLYVDTFPSAIQAQRVLGINQARISACCYGKPYRKTAGGYIWRFSTHHQK